MEYMASQKLHALETANTNSRCTPPLSKIKCNIDGVVFMNNEIVGWVAIVRSDSGHFVCCIIGFKSGIIDPFMTKVIAACEAFLSLHSWHAKNAILEIDNRHLWDTYVASC
ncbi:hypothetical protein Goarm_004772 [Gossypium armourianum]|uniref:RNase H type-1 domain-containing protein n=1 Tax=Gossypium armourianum TaxID=34283 RepID=A0A7J9JXT9_9ROSI|nr:hypothetical protein [Gossypium armourianum]